MQKAKLFVWKNLKLLKNVSAVILVYQSIACGSAHIPSPKNSQSHAEDDPQLENVQVVEPDVITSEIDPKATVEEKQVIQTQFKAEELSELIRFVRKYSSRTDILKQIDQEIAEAEKSLGKLKEEVQVRELDGRKPRKTSLSKIDYLVKEIEKFKNYRTTWMTLFPKK